jgi:hypothetical protein
LAVTALAAYLLDAAGLGLQPWPALATGAAAAVALAMARPRPVAADAGELAAWGGIVLFLAAVLLRLSWPELVPPGRGPDLTHHLLLVDYIEQQRHLVHDRSLSGAMGEMAHYTPGSHLLAVIGGAAAGIDGMRAFFPLAVLCAALTAGFVFLIARRAGLSIPYGVVSVALLFLPAPYFFGAFTHDGFLAQTISTLFAVAMWWALLQWDDQPTVAGAATIAVLAAATFLSWPIWVGPPLVVFAGMAAAKDLRTRERARDLAIVLAPLAVIVLIHSWERWGWMAIVRTSGAVLRPSLDSLGAVLPLLAAAGLALTAAERRARATLVLLLIVALQAATLYAVARAQGADTPYLALKMMYLAIYPMAVLAALALARASSMARAHDPVGWLLAAALVVLAVRPALAAPRSLPVVDLDLHAAGRWLRANGGAACADYLVADAETAYWLHLAVLGNPRTTEATRALDDFDANSAMAPWIAAGGRRYAIADLRLLPDEVRNRVQILTAAGHAAVIARDATMKGCD